MKAVTTIKKLLRGTRGVATSLIEATATVAVGAVLAGVAVGSAVDAINDSKIQAALADVQTTGQGVITFYKDNAFFPLFKVGSATGPNDDFFNNLVSESGTCPTDSTTGTTWDIPAAPTAYVDAAGRFGHQVIATDDTIEGHLVSNLINRTTADGGLTFTGSDAYPDRGTIPGDPFRGWSGPYIASPTKTDPWGNKYLINVRKLHVKHFADIGASETLPQIGVVVISAGPNRALETSSSQAGETFQVVGDDIVFRIK